LTSATVFLDMKFSSEVEKAMLRQGGGKSRLGIGGPFPRLTNAGYPPKTWSMDAQLQNLKFDSAGLIPAIIQDFATGQVLMMAWMNRDSLQKTVQTGKTHFFSRSRNKLWLKGETSGHVQHVKSIAMDCDQDVLLIKVEQVGAACHEGYYSCFFREYQAKENEWKIVAKRKFEPETVYKK
jgi:phosphoribosyl-AMP cyclohydrolase